MSKTETKGLTPKLERKRNKAAIMFVKDCKPVKAICDQLEISTNTFAQWSKAGYWVELRPGSRMRPNPSIRKAQILFVKNGLSLTEICQRIDVSMPTLKKWKDAEAWHELRPDFELLNKPKAANLYIEKGLGTCEISQLLNISETIVKIWILTDGWNAARQVSQSEDVTVNVVASFCTYFRECFPQLSAEIETVQSGYIHHINFKTTTI